MYSKIYSPRPVNKKSSMGTKFFFSKNFKNEIELIDNDEQFKNGIEKEEVKREIFSILEHEYDNNYTDELMNNYRVETPPRVSNSPSKILNA